MSVTMNQYNPASQVPTKVLSASQMVGLSIMGEVDDLQKLDLIGKDSMMTWNLFSKAEVVHWSKKDYQQWQAYQNEGSAAALSAAQYQVKMREERLDAVNDYLGQVYDLSAQYSQLEGVKLSFAKYLDYQQGEREKPAADDVELAKISVFWRKNRAAVQALEDSYSQLQKLPKDLDSWLHLQDFPIDDEVFAAVDQMKNAWTTTHSDQAIAPEYAPVTASFDNGRVDGMEMFFEEHSGVTPEITDGTSFYTAWDGIGLAGGQTLYESWGSTHQLIDEAAKELLSSQQLETYKEMQVLGAGLYQDVSKLFGAAAGFADFSMQDMVDNFIAGQPVGTLDNGFPHPQAEQIEAFWEKNQHALTLYSYKQELIDNPMDIKRFKEVYISDIKRHLQQNLEYFLNKKLPSEYNV